jgi:hypothetical protein
LIHSAALLPEFCINKEAEPEGLQYPEYEALGSIELTETKKIAIDDRAKGPIKSGNRLYF